MNQSDFDNWTELLAYFENDELAAKVWVTKYASKPSKGKCLEFVPSDMHRRLAKEFFRIEKKYAESIDLTRVFPLLGYEASQIIIN